MGEIKLLVGVPKIPVYSDIENSIITQIAISNYTLHTLHSEDIWTLLQLKIIGLIAREFSIHISFLAVVAKSCPTSQLFLLSSKDIDSF